MPVINWNVIIAGLLYAALSGIFNFAFAHKSQIETWSLTKPRLAAFLKLTRAIGLDPWNIAASALLLFKKRLPVAQQNGAKAVAALIESEVPVPSKPTIPPMFPGATILLLAIGFAVHAQGCGPTKPPCDQAKLAAIVAVCTARSQQCVNEGKSEAECSSLNECDDEIDRACGAGK